MAKLKSTQIYGNLDVTGEIHGNASSSTKLKTPRQINGTNFDGTANITTEQWGKPRNIQIGKTSKSVNGSANVSWTLEDIGASDSAHSHGLLHSNLTVGVENTATDNGWSMINSSYNGFILKSIRANQNAPAWLLNNYAAGIAFGGGDTKGVMSVSYNGAYVRFAGGNGTKPVWNFTLKGSNARQYDLDMLYNATADNTANMIVKRDGNGNFKAGTITASLSGNASTATKLQTGRVITIGNTNRTFDGTANITWTVADIGAAPTNHTHTSNQITDATNANTANMIVKRDANGNFSAGTITASLSGNASTATKLATARQINGTNFDGTGNITTANWGTARNLKIGNYSVSVNGSGNYSWNLEQINGVCVGTGTGGNTNKYQKIGRIDVSSGNWVGCNGILYIMDIEYQRFSGALSIYVRSTDVVHNQQIKLKWLSIDNPNYVDKVYLVKSSNRVYDIYIKTFETYTTIRFYFIPFTGVGCVTLTGSQALVDSITPLYTSSYAETIATRLATARQINGTNFDGTANITTANWGTARNIQIGNTTRSVNGSGNYTWSLSDIGAAASNHSHNSIASRGRVTCETGTTKPAVTGGLSMTEAYNNGYPVTYGNVLTMSTGSGGSTQLLLEWNGTSGATGRAYIRNKRDMYDASWSSWSQIYTSTHKPSPSDIGAASSDHSHNHLNNYYTSRPTSANVSVIGDGHLRTFKVTSSMTTAKPYNDGHILHFEWDNNNGYSSQIFIGNSSDPKMQIRGMSSGTWGDWHTVYSTNNKPTPAAIGAAPSSHTHDRISGPNSNLVQVNQPNDYAGLAKKNNVNIDTWYGFSISNKCSGQSVAVDGVAFSVNARTGEIYTPAKLTSSMDTGTHLSGANGKAIINSTSNSEYVVLAKAESTNGKFTLAKWTTRFVLNYIANTSVSANKNEVTKQLVLLHENGNSDFPGTVTAPTFKGALTGNASTATTLQTARTINGTSFNGSGNITTANWGTARTITIGSAGKSVNGSGNVSWSLSEIGAVPAATGSSITIHADNDASTTTEYLMLKAGHNELKITTSGGGSTVTKGQDKLTFNGNVVYHAGKKPTAADVGALPLSGGKMTGNIGFSGSGYSGTAIVFEGSDANAAYLGLGAGGLTVIGSGESTSKVKQSSGYGAGSEKMFVASDEEIIFLSNMQDGWDASKQVTIDRAGVVVAPQGVKGNLTGNASTSTKLQNIRSINGTNFDGTGNITTANWGTARNIQIGNTTRSVNGSGNYTWSLSDIGAAPSSHTHSSLKGARGGNPISSSVSTGYLQYNYGIDKNTAGLFPWVSNANGLLTINKHEGNYYSQLGFSSNGKLYYRNFEGVALNTTTGWSEIAFTTSVVNAANKLQTARTINGTNFDGTANITTANWGTARSITIGNSGKSVNGSANVTWSLSEIGAVPVSTGSSIKIHADSDASSTDEYLLLKAGHNELKIMSSAGGTTATKGADKLTFNGSIVYHTGRKPTLSELGAAASSHTHTSAQISDATASNNANTVVKRDGSGNFNAGRITLSNWIYCSGNTGIYFNTHGGGWYMTDTTWIRAYGDKSIYTKKDIKADGKLYAGSAQINGGMNATGWVSGSGITSVGGWYEVTKGEAMKLRSGSGNIIFMPVEGTSMVQLYPNGNNTGNLGTADIRWSRIYTVNGMNQSSDSRYKTNIETVNTSDCFEMIKNIDVYTYILLGEDKRKLSRQQLIEKTQENKNNIEIGVIAQDIAKFKYGKYIVEKGDSSENEDSFYAISPYNLTSATIAALKEEINLRESLESKVETLESEIQELKSLVTQLLNR